MYNYARGHSEPSTHPLDLMSPGMCSLQSIWYVERNSTKTYDTFQQELLHQTSLIYEQNSQWNSWCVRSTKAVISLHGIPRDQSMDLCLAD